MKDPIRLSAELGDKLCEVLSSEGELVTKWVAVAEVIDKDGQRWLRTFWPDDAMPWDSIGMLVTATDDQRQVDWQSKDEAAE